MHKICRVDQAQRLHLSGV